MSSSRTTNRTSKTHHDGEYERYKATYGTPSESTSPMSSTTSAATTPTMASETSTPETPLSATMFSSTAALPTAPTVSTVIVTRDPATGTSVVTRRPSSAPETAAAVVFSGEGKNWIGPKTLTAIAGPREKTPTSLLGLLDFDFLKGHDPVQPRGSLRWHIAHWLFEDVRDTEAVDCFGAEQAHVMVGKPKKNAKSDST